MLVEFAIFEKKVKAQITVLLQKQRNCKKKKKKKKNKKKKKKKKKSKEKKILEYILLSGSNKVG